MEIQEENIKFIYEAAFTAIEFQLFEEKPKPLPCFKACESILRAFDLYNKEKCIEFLNNYHAWGFEQEARQIAAKIMEEDTISFFEALSAEEKFLFHSFNYEVSFHYGVRLSSIIDFTGKCILDIGGSSGGLVSGIKTNQKNVSAYVFDLPEAVHAGKEITKDINFIEGNFFKDKITGAYDYIILSNIIHDWDNEASKIILKNLQDIFTKNTKLLIYEDILTDNTKAFLYGLRLSANFRGARQRNLKEIHTLIKSIWHDAEIDFFHEFSIHSCAVFNRGMNHSLRYP